MVYKISLHRKEKMKLELPQAIDYFLTAMTLEGKSPYTILWHRKKLPTFVKFLQDSGRSLKVDDLTVEDARAFIKHLIERTTRYAGHVMRNEMEGHLCRSPILTLAIIWFGVWGSRPLPPTMQPTMRKSAPWRWSFPPDKPPRKRRKLPSQLS